MVQRFRKYAFNFSSISEIAKSGQISEYFDQRGYACVEKAKLTEEKATELAIEINAEEVVEAIDDDGVREVWKVYRSIHQTRTKTY
jgi:transcriptional/translational regulatory protein YebC/TACO1